MSYEPDEDEDPEFVPDYFAEVDEGDLTGNEPKFVKVPSSEHDPSELSEMSVADLITKSIEIRNQLATDRKGWKAREARLKTAREIISMQLRDRADSLGLDSFAGTTGTAYRNKKEKFTVSDWDRLGPWLSQTGEMPPLAETVLAAAAKGIPLG